MGNIVIHKSWHLDLLHSCHLLSMSWRLLLSVLCQICFQLNSIISFFLGLLPHIGEGHLPVVFEKENWEVNILRPYLSQDVKCFYFTVNWLSNSCGSKNPLEFGFLQHCWRPCPYLHYLPSVDGFCEMCRPCASESWLRGLFFAFWRPICSVSQYSSISWFRTVS